jgi:hypothetical protein
MKTIRKLLTTVVLFGAAFAPPTSTTVRAENCEEHCASYACSYCGGCSGVCWSDIFWWCMKLHCS